MVLNSLRRRGSQFKLSSRQIREEKHRKMALCLLGAVSGVVSVLGHLESHIDKQPMHTSVLTGQRWVDELLKGMQFILIVMMIGHRGRQETTHTHRQKERHTDMSCDTLRYFRNNVSHTIFFIVYLFSECVVF